MVYVASERALLLINLGTPDSPEPKKVGEYLREFLMDPFVIDIPKVLRWILVNVVIVPKRSHDSAKLYKKVWGREGSPLLVHLEALTKKVQAKLAGKYLVERAMRYGKPSIQEAVQKLKASGVKEVTVLPLYPQYSLAATQSSVERVTEVFSEVYPEIKPEFIRYFYNSDYYLEATAKVTEKYLKDLKWDFVLFSFHGLPERQVKKTDPSHNHCLKSQNCCDQITEINGDCYRAQSYATARALAEKLGIPREKYEVGFQSRLKGAPWIRPFSDEFYRELPKKGIKRLVVISPSFVADCLETLEEIQIRGKEEFVEHGGEELTLVPSLNSEDFWVEAVANLIDAYQPNK